jgi:hypothetical protein
VGELTAEFFIWFFRIKNDLQGVFVVFWIFPFVCYFFTTKQKKKKKFIWKRGRAKKKS